jgi:hypothetical protein
LIRNLTDIGGHQIEELRPEQWKAVAAMSRDPGESRPWFENPLDTDLLAVYRCRACGRAFILLALGEHGLGVTDEHGSDLDVADEHPCTKRLLQS